MLTVNVSALVRASTGVTCSSIVILSSVRLKSNAMPASVAPTGTHGAPQATPRAAVSAGTVGGVEGLYTCVYIFAGPVRTLDGSFQLVKLATIRPPSRTRARRTGARLRHIRRPCPRERACPAE